MLTRILKRLGVFSITVIIFVAVIAPCFNLGEKDVYAASSYTYTNMVRKSIPLDEENGKTLDYYLVEVLDGDHMKEKAPSRPPRGEGIIKLHSRVHIHCLGRITSSPRGGREGVIAAVESI